MLILSLLLSCLVQDAGPATPLPDTEAVPPAPALLGAWVSVRMPNRLPSLEHLDEVFERPPRIEPGESVWHDALQVDVSGSAGVPVAVPADAVGYILPDLRPVDFAPGARPTTLRLHDGVGQSTYGSDRGEESVPFAGLLSAKALWLPDGSVADLPWSRDPIVGAPLASSEALHGRVADAGGHPLSALEVFGARVAPIGELVGLDHLGRTGPEGLWPEERWKSPNRDDPEFAPKPERSGPQVPPQPAVKYLCLRAHESHAWQVFESPLGGTVYLGEPALLSVYLVDDEGQPVDDVDLRLGPATRVAPGLLDLPGPVPARAADVVRDTGSWEIAGLPRDRYRIYARAPGHAPAAALIDLASGHRELELVLHRATPLTVRVLDAEGDAVSDAHVRVSLAGTELDPRGGGARPASLDVPVDGSTTDAEGRATIDRAPLVGPLHISAEHHALGAAEMRWEPGAREVMLTLSGEPLPPRTTGTWGALYDRLQTD